MKKIILTLALIGVTLSGYFIYNFSPVLASVRYAQTQPFFLAGSGSSVGATSITLTSMNDIDGTIMTMASFGSHGYGTLEPGKRSREEQISFTGITSNANGTVTLTGVKNVVFIYPYTEASGTLRSHPGGSTFVVSNTSGFYNTLTNKENNETITGYWNFSAPISTTTSPVTLSYASSTVVDLHTAQTIAGVKTFSDSISIASGKVISWAANNGVISGLATPVSSDTDHSASVAYVNAVALSGVASSSPTVTGATKISVAAVDANDPIAVGDNDIRVQNYLQVVSTSTDSYGQLTTPLTGYGTSTLPGVPFGTSTRIEIFVASSSPGTAFGIIFNDDTGADRYYNTYSYSGTPGNSDSETKYIRFVDGSTSVPGGFYITIDLINSTSSVKVANWQMQGFNAVTLKGTYPWTGGFTWASTTAAVNKITVGQVNGQIGTTTIRAIVTK